MLKGMLQLDGLDRVGPTVGPTGRFYVIYALIVEQGLVILIIYFSTCLVGPCGALLL